MLCSSNTDMIVFQLRKWCTLSLLVFSDSIQRVISLPERARLTASCKILSERFHSYPFLLGFSSGTLFTRAMEL